MRSLVAILLLSVTLAAPVWASCTLSSVRLPAGLVKVGDSERRVIQSEPDRVVRLETAAGGAAGYRFDFYRRGETIQVYTRAGRVIRVCRIRE